MHTNRRLSTFLAASTAALAIALALPAAAFARSTSGSAGRSVVGSNDTCVNIEGYGGVVRNDCEANVWYEIPLPADGSAPDEWYDVWVAVEGIASGHSVACGSHGLNYDSAGVPWYSWSSPNLRWVDVLGRFADIYVPVYVPPGGALFADCLMEPNGRIMKVEYR